MTYQQFACEYLSGEVKERYIDNIVRECGEEKLNHNSQITDPIDYIWAAFLWYGTPEGNKYWADVVSKMQIDIHHFAPEPKAPEKDDVIEIKAEYIFWGVVKKPGGALIDSRPVALYKTRKMAREVAQRYCPGTTVKKFMVWEA